MARMTWCTWTKCGGGSSTADAAQICQDERVQECHVFISKPCGIKEMDATFIHVNAGGTDLQCRQQCWN